MLTFDVQDFKQAFHRTGHIRLTIAGKPHQVPFTTERYEETRRAYIEAHPFPGRTVVGSKVIKPQSAEGKEMGISRPTIVEIVKARGEDTAWSQAVSRWSAGLGRALAAACLQVELQAGGVPITGEALTAFYESAMADSQASELVASMGALVSLEDQDAADFFESTSGVDGEPESHAPEGLS